MIIFLSKSIVYHESDLYHSSLCLPVTPILEGQKKIRPEHLPTDRSGHGLQRSMTADYLEGTGGSDEESRVLAG